jgi:DNA-directed RNA polymerase subunit RPC12/RpoP
LTKFLKRLIKEDMRTMIKRNPNPEDKRLEYDPLIHCESCRKDTPHRYNHGERVMAVGRDGEERNLIYKCMNCGRERRYGRE